MFSAKNFHDYNKVSARDNLRFLEEYNEKIPWSRNCQSVIDIGSGDGSFTANVLYKFMPDNFKELVGCDKSDNMVQYAKEHYIKDNVTYKVLDIEGALPGNFYNRFNQAFSFFTLHWPRNQKKVFSNIYNMLAPGGGVFFVIMGNGPSYYDVYRILSESKRWGQYMTNVENIISFYHYVTDPVKMIETIMSDLGFTDIEVSRRKNTYKFNTIEDYKLAIKAVNGFPIPENEFNNYLDDFAKVSQERGFINDKFEIVYETILVQGKKKLN